MSKIKLSLLSLVASTSLFGANNIEIKNIGLTEGSLKYEITLFNKKITINNCQVIS